MVSRFWLLTFATCRRSDVGGGRSWKPTTINSANVPGAAHPNGARAHTPTLPSRLSKKIGKLQFSMMYIYLSVESLFILLKNRVQFICPWMRRGDQWILRTSTSFSINIEIRYASLFTISNGQDGSVAKDMVVLYGCIKAHQYGNLVLFCQRLCSDREAGEEKKTVF
jgi:hypothetical protein